MSMTIRSYLDPAQRTAEQKRLSRIARASSKRQKELTKPGPSMVLKFKDGQLVEAQAKGFANISDSPQIAEVMGRAKLEPAKHWTAERLHKDAVVVPTIEQASLAPALDVV